MEADIVCISDDDEREEENKLVAAATDKMKNMYFNFNVYDYSYVKRMPEKEVPKEVQKETVVYVPDDSEEEVLLMGPIRNVSRKILFGENLSGVSMEFPHKLLLMIESHLAKSLRNVSFTTETNVWKCTLEQLTCIKIAYNGVTDVSLFFIFYLLLFLFTVLCGFD